MTNSDNQKEFEEWARTVNPVGLDNAVARNNSGEYIWSGTSFAWQVWQARQPEIDALKAELAELRQKAEGMREALGEAHEILYKLRQRKGDNHLPEFLQIRGADLSVQKAIHEYERAHNDKR